jgi:lipoprotein-anchoring transpeptidase ErfK/SrfK
LKLAAPHFSECYDVTEFSPSTLSRRALLGGGAAFLALAAAGCSTTAPAPSVAVGPPPVAPPPAQDISLDIDVLTMYQAIPEETFSVPAADLERLDPKYVRRVVDYITAEKPGTVIVDTDARYLYHVQPGDLATPIRCRHRPRWVRMVGPRSHRLQA